MRPAVAVSLVLLAQVVMAPAVRAQPVSVELQAEVKPGEHPSLLVSSQASLARVHVDLMRDDGKKLQLEHGAVAAGQKARMVLPLPPGGRAVYEGTLVATYSDGTQATVPLHFDTASAATMKIGYARERLDLEAHTLEFTLSRPAAHAELRVLGDDGSELGKASADYEGDKPGTWLKLSWTPTAPGNVLALELRARSTDGSSAGVRLTPWSVRIAHEEVIFESGKAEIRPSEAAKLDASYKRIIDTVNSVRKVEPNLPVKLFIAGHTDTVGSGPDNVKLSLARARAIAAWFRDRGLPLPIAFAGFGESALKVKTADNTDEPANRRADYIVGVEEPQVVRGVRASWYKLQ
jgi:outer membrane protein OmpA-like peptidoglycan-associated protein